MKPKYLALIILFFGVGGMLQYLISGRWQYIFWFCNHASIIIGILILLKNKYWLTAELSLALIPQLIWSIDFFGFLLFKKTIFGITDYVFEAFTFQTFFSLQHIVVPILTIIAVYKIGAAKNAWKGALFHGVIIALISYFLISKDYNINCMHQPCIFFFNSTPTYPIAWILIIFLIVVYPTSILLYNYLR